MYGRQREEERRGKRKKKKKERRISKQKSCLDCRAANPKKECPIVHWAAQIEFDARAYRE
jgi:hypothetical protein